MRREISPAERRALVICKLLGQAPALSIDELRLLSKPRAYAKRQRYLRRLSVPDNFESALELAIARGWLSQGQDRLALSAEGRKVGLRTRAGMHRRRLNEVGFDAAGFLVRSSRTP